MSIFQGEEVIRDGFASSYGRFFANPGRVEVIPGQDLRAVFLPKVKAERRKKKSRERLLCLGPAQALRRVLRATRALRQGDEPAEEGLAGRKVRQRVRPHSPAARSHDRGVARQTDAQELSVSPDWAMQR
jgi:hypothetical protein